MTEYSIFRPHACESIHRLAGTYNGAIVRPVDAGDGEVGEVIWICRDRHGSAPAAKMCAVGELAERRQAARQAARERVLAGWSDESDDPDSLEYRG